MRPSIKRYSAVGKTATDGSILFPVNNLQIAFAVGLGILFSSDAGGTSVANVLFTYDDMSPDFLQPVQISQTTTVITVVDPALPAKGGVTTADVGKIVGTGIAGVDGEWPVASVISPTSYTLTSSISQSKVSNDAKGAIYHMFPSLITTPAGARTFGNLSAGLAAATATGILNSGPVTAVALNVTILPTGSAYLQVLQAMGR